MNLRNDYTKNMDKLQAAHQDWNEKIASHLPKNIEEILAESKVVKRKREIGSGLELLKIFFLFASSRLSFRMLSLCSAVLSIAGISDTAWRKQLKKSIPFLHSLLDTMLHTLNLGSVNKSHTRRLYAVDASTFRQEGKEQRQGRLHLSYDLIHNCINQVKITDVHTAESFHNFEIEEGAVYLADAGYGTARNYAHICKKKADAVMRISPSHFNLYTSEGEKVSLHAYLLELRRNKAKASSELRGYSVYEGRNYYVRIVIYPLSRQKAEEERRNKKRKSQKNGNKIKEETLVSAGFVLLATSLGEEYDREEILSLYNVRWQIELFFKRLKQNFKIQVIRSAGEGYLMAIIYCWIILWVIMEKQIILAEKFWEETSRKGRKMTTWSETQLFYSKIIEIITLSWSCFIDIDNIDLLNHHLDSRPGRRKNQNNVLHSYILDTLIA